jgi:nucleoside-diphosphate-sugar epimerase
MRLAITGSGGFLGNRIGVAARRNGHAIVPIPLSGHLTGPDQNAYCELISRADDCDVVINCAAAKRARTALDWFINAEAPGILASHLAKQGEATRLLHLSSLNVVISRLADPYTLGKRASERRLAGYPVMILRPGLIWSLDDAVRIEELERLFALPIPVLPMFCPGNSYRPVLVDDLAELIVELCEQGLTPETLNVFGDQRVDLWDLLANYARRRKRRLVPLRTAWLGKIGAFEVIANRHELFQQLLTTDRSPDNSSGERTIVLPFPTRKQLAAGDGECEDLATVNAEKQGNSP